MNNYNINDEELNNSLEYQNFIKENKGEGYLRIRAYGASEAVPIKGLKIVVSTLIDDNTRVIFYEGETDSSGMIERLNLPAPKRGDDNLVIPKWTVYDIRATYNDITEIFKVNLYDGICVQQVINITPSSLVRGFNYGN